MNKKEINKLYSKAKRVTVGERRVKSKKPKEYLQIKKPESKGCCFKQSSYK
jgi:hypothetical protein